MPPSLSLIVPARNEAGNIPLLVPRLTGLEGVSAEIIFVEGHSQDRTWEAIQEVCRRKPGHFTFQGLRQTGIGKADAVRLGLARARGEILAIFDADLSTPPEQVTSLYFHYLKTGHGLLIGNRFSLPMERGAMRLLNRLGNRFFSAWLSLLTGTRMPDVLCGTKLLRARDYRALRSLTGNFERHDPFGDFELILGVARLGLPIESFPIPYRSRTYGSTNIRRFRDGFRLAEVSVRATLAFPWRSAQGNSA